VILFKIFSVSTRAVGTLRKSIIMTHEMLMRKSISPWLLMLGRSPPKLRHSARARDRVRLVVDT